MQRSRYSPNPSWNVTLNPVATGAITGVCMNRFLFGRSVAQPTFSFHVSQPVASYFHGKQRRSKPRKEETQKTASAEAATVFGVHQAHHHSKALISPGAGGDAGATKADSVRLTGLPFRRARWF